MGEIGDGEAWRLRRSTGWAKPDLLCVRMVWVLQGMGTGTAVGGMEGPGESEKGVGIGGGEVRGELGDGVAGPEELVGGVAGPGELVGGVAGPGERCRGVAGPGELGGGRSERSPWLGWSVAEAVVGGESWACSGWVGSR